MKVNAIRTLVFACCLCLLFIPIIAEAKDEKKNQDALTLPKNIISITKTNTYTNKGEESTVVEPNDFTKQLLEEITLPIDNHSIISLLNESTVKTTPFSFGYDANIYLGRWPLHYTSESSSVIWDYEHINTNELNNWGNNKTGELSYVQENDYVVKGALTNKIEDSEVIKDLILQKIKGELDLPLSFSTKVGANSKLKEVYHVGAEKIGTLDAYVPAIHEKGYVVYGDLFLQSKGANIQLQIKNVTKHSIGAWIPIVDHIALTYTVK